MLLQENYKFITTKFTKELFNSGLSFIDVFRNIYLQNDKLTMNHIFG